MYSTLLVIHSLFRWLVLLSLGYAVYKALKGYAYDGKFLPWDENVRHWTATIAHVQLVIGVTIYSQSPIISYFWTNKERAIENLDVTFFTVIHLLLMLAAVVFITIGSCLAKRKVDDTAKFKTMLFWFAIALIIICVAVPWPFSPLASRPYFR